MDLNYKRQISFLIASDYIATAQSILKIRKALPSPHHHRVSYNYPPKRIKVKSKAKDIHARKKVAHMSTSQ
jgi:hypothetical protein